MKELTAAKSALNKAVLQITLPHTESKPLINKYSQDKWQ